MNGTSPIENAPNTSPMYLASSVVVRPWANRSSAQRRAEHAEEDRRGHDDDRRDAHALGEVVANQRVPPVGGVPAHPGQQRADDRDADDRVGQLEELVGVRPGGEADAV